MLISVICLTVLNYQNKQFEFLKKINECLYLVNGDELIGQCLLFRKNYIFQNRMSKLICLDDHTKWYAIKLQ